jgi:AraC-like DNA-binding protein
MSLLVRAACLTHYSDVARAGGLDPGTMLRSAGLSVDIESEPDRLIPVECVGHLLHESATLSGNEAFGLSMAESRRLSNLGPVGLAMRDQATLRESLAVLMRHQALLNGSLSLRVEEQGGLVVLREQVRAGRPRQPVRQRIELAMGVMLRLLRHFLPAGWRPRRVCFEHPAPRDLAVHRRLLGECLEFGADFNGIVFASTDLDAPNPAADPTMARYAMQLLQAAPPAKPPSLADDVRHTIAVLLPRGRCGLEQVCADLGLPVRTVQRALADQGQSFSVLLDEVRRDLALRLVLDSDRPLTEVAPLLGFSAPSAFSRWYQVQFGHSATHSRESRAAEPGAAR